MQIRPSHMRHALLKGFVLTCMVLIVMMARAQHGFSPFPKASDGYWRKHIPEAMRNDYIRLGNQYVGKPWNAIPASVFAEFRINGNRTNYEALSFGIRNQFACLVMAEIMQNKGRFLPSIREGLHYFMEKEPWWGIPAHYPKDHPEHDLQPVDLFNAETSGMLAWTLYMLGDEIEREEKGLTDSVRNEIERRFLNPTLYNKQGWKGNANNWNTWITSNWLETALICENDSKKRADAIQGVKQCLRTFLRGYPDDGGCEEGVGYWDRAGASFFESLFFLDKASKDTSDPSSNVGASSNTNFSSFSDSAEYSISSQASKFLSESQWKKVEAMGQFITTMHINDLTFVNFSDAQAKNVPNINILFPYGAYLKDERMMQLAAYVGEKFHYLTTPSTLFLRSGNYPTLGRELMLLSMLPQFEQTKPLQQKVRDAYLANSQVMVASDDEWFLAAKGGNNAESHNHNDIGNFIIYHDNQPVVIDLGRDTYTSQTFSNRRYEMMNNRSSYHNVPIINGLEQKDGKQYKAEKVSHIQNDSISSLQLNIDKAYPDEAHVDAWRRMVSLNRKARSVEITEQYKLDSLQIEKDRLNGNVFDNRIVLMAYGKPNVLDSSRILLCDGCVRLSFDKQYLSAFIEKVQMPDGIMKTEWNDEVYRIILRLNDNYPKAKLTYLFEKVEKPEEKIARNNKKVKPKTKSKWKRKAKGTRRK